METPVIPTAAALTRNSRLKCTILQLDAVPLISAETTGNHYMPSWRINCLFELAYLKQIQGSYASSDMFLT